MVFTGVYAYANIVHTQADQLLPQLLMEQFDTLPIQCRHIEHMLFSVVLVQPRMTRPCITERLLIKSNKQTKHMHEGVWLKKIIFDKITAMRTMTIFP